MMKNRGWILTIGLVVLVAAGVYYWLGGFRSPRAEKVQYPARVVWGTRYQGQYGDIKLREIFVKIQRQLAENGELGTLTVVNYDSQFNTNAVNQLIGFLPKAAPDSLKSNRSPDTLAAGSYLRLHVYGRPAVRSTPAQIHQKARDYARQNDQELGEKVVEQYFGPDSMWVEYPLRAR